MPDWAKAFFPKLDERNYEAVQAAMETELDRVVGLIVKLRDPKSGQIACKEVVRARESVLRFLVRHGRS